MLGDIMNLKEIILDYQTKTGYSLAEIARRVGVSRSTATRWVKGDIQSLSYDTMEQLSKLVGYNVEPHLKGMDISMHLPILGYVKGGYDLFNEDNYLGEEEVSLQEKKLGDFYLQVTGDSMIGDGILDGSLVLVQKTTHFTNGMIGVVAIGDEVTVKKLKRKGNLLILEASNPDVETRYFTPEEIQTLPITILGKVVLCKKYF